MGARDLRPIFAPLPFTPEMYSTAGITNLFDTNSETLAVAMTGKASWFTFVGKGNTSELKVRFSKNVSQ